MWINLNGNVVNFDNYITVELRENKPLHGDQSAMLLQNIVDSN